MSRHMMALCITVAALVLAGLLRFGAEVEYGEGGISADARVGPFRIPVFPVRGKEDRGKKGQQDKREAKVKAKKKPPEGRKIPGDLDTIKEILKAAGTTLGRLRRKVRIKRLIIWYVASAKDPSKAAISFGISNAAVGIILPFLDKHFKIGKREFNASVDYEKDKPAVYVNAAISIALWEALYIACALVPPVIKLAVSPKQQTKRKDGINDGKTPD